MFLTALQVEELDDTSADGRGTWRLLVDLVYSSPLAALTFTVPAGFVTDFASVPRYLPIAFALTGDTAHRAAVIHDWLYTTHQVDRATADAVLREAAISCGVPTWRADLLWEGVRIGGSGPWLAHANPQAAPAHQTAITETETA